MRLDFSEWLNIGCFEKSVNVHLTMLFDYATSYNCGSKMSLVVGTVLDQQELHIESHGCPGYLESLRNHTGVHALSD